MLGHIDGLTTVYAKCLGDTSFEITNDDTDDVLEMGFKELGCEAQPLNSNEIIGRTVLISSFILSNHFQGPVAQKMKVLKL